MRNERTHPLVKLSPFRAHVGARRQESNLGLFDTIEAPFRSATTEAWGVRVQ